jgi:hypothetical protein
MILLESLTDVYTRGMRSSYKILSENLNGREHVQGLGIDGRIILK